jgi:hypothetical protein
LCTFINVVDQVPPAHPTEPYATLTPSAPATENFYITGGDAAMDEPPTTPSSVCTLKRAALAALIVVAVLGVAGTVTVAIIFTSSSKQGKKESTLNICVSHSGDF